MECICCGKARLLGAVLAVLVLAAGCVERLKFTPATPPVPTAPVLRLPANDAYEGSVVTGALQPVFSWEPSTVEEGTIGYELQVSADRTFATGVQTFSAAEPRYQPGSPLSVATTPPVGTRYYWRVRACVEDRCSEYSPPWWVNVGRSLKDFNGDGYDDLIVGSHTDINDASLPGRAFVYFGGPGAFDTTPDGQLNGASAGDNFGYSVGAAGDFNGDGFADVAVGSSLASYLYFGGPGLAFDTQVDLILQGVTGVKGVGDLNHDGFSDLVAFSSQLGDKGSTKIYLGGDRPDGVADASIDGTVSGENLGSTTGGGDINGDGISDLVLGRSKYQAGSIANCMADIFPGSASQPFALSKAGTIAGLPSERCNANVRSMGDVNADGFADVLLHASDGANSIRLYLGRKEVGNIPVDIAFNINSNSIVLDTSFIGDINNDGALDLSVTERVNRIDDVISIYLGKPKATAQALSTTKAGTLSDSDASTVLGFVVRGIGDANKDGIGDFAVSDPGYNDSTGRVMIYFGNAGATMDMSYDVFLSAGVVRRFFGEAIAWNSRALDDLPVAPYCAVTVPRKPCA